MLSPAVCGILKVLARQYGAIGTEIASIDKSIMALHRGCEASRLAGIPGIGPIGATALVAEIGDWKTFSSGRSVAAWIGWCRSSTPPAARTGSWQHHQAGQSIFAVVAGGRGNGRYPATRASTERRSVPGSAD